MNSEMKKPSCTTFSCRWKSKKKKLSPIQGIRKTKDTVGKINSMAITRRGTISEEEGKMDMETMRHRRKKL